MRAAARRHRHEMPFGAELVPEGVRFRLWAPAARAVAVVLLDGDTTRHTVPLHPQPDGWYELVSAQGHAGTRYRFRIDEGLQVPDPAARAHDDVRGASIVVDPLAYPWRSHAWRGRPWHESVIYELHVGTYTPEGTFAALSSRLDHLVELGVTVVELMPVADFAGARGWGYDGVLAFAPDAAYGEPEDLKAFIDAAHERGLAVMLDVVYNHFGPEGNWLHAYAPQFFTNRHQTPWGAAINFDQPHSRTVRDCFVHNALYWLEEFQLDGLRLDAVHCMHDSSPVHFIAELAQRVREGPGKQRPVSLVLENNANAAALLGAPGAADRADAQWNDDLHHCLHVILTGEKDGYYGDYFDRPHALLARCLAEGFAYQGEVSPHDGNRPRGEPSAHLPPGAFVNFLQNHDQIGNRAFGERLHALTKDDAPLVAATAIVLLAPSPPLLFMGEEWAAPEPFAYFCDFAAELAQKVREGRQREFAAFESFTADRVRALPDPTDVTTFERARLDWSRLLDPRHSRWHSYYRELLTLRREQIVPLLPHLKCGGRRLNAEPSTVIDVGWASDDGRLLRLIANLSPSRRVAPGPPPGRLIYATHPQLQVAEPRAMLEPWSVSWLEYPDAAAVPG